MAFRSKFKLNAKLQACAIADKDHIGETTYPVENRTGDHVALIHEALNAWAAKQPPPVKPVAAGEVTAKTFGSDTSRVVTLFKIQKNLLNYQNKIDPIVGIKTVANLDLELPPLSDPTPNVPKKLIADVVVRFQGAHSVGQLKPDDVLNSFLVQVYNPMPDQPFGDKVLLNPHNGRALIRVGRLTTTIGGDSLNVFSLVIAEILKLTAGVKAPVGKIFIHGSSSGGRNAIDFAAHLSRTGFVPHLVAAVDAAFFQTDTFSRPEGEVAHPTTIPVFSLSAGATRNRHNFFQTIGNHTKKSFSHGLLFTSAMAGEEIHGDVTGFTKHDLTRSIPRPLQISDDEAHIECGRQGVREALRLIADELLLQT